MPLNVSPQFLVVAIFSSSVACSAGDSDEASGSDQFADGSSPTSASGGSLAPSVQEPSASTGGLGGAESEAEEEINHPLFGAGSYPSAAPTDPCIAAQHWEESTNLDLTTGALILDAGIVYEVTGIGKSESTWADEWTAPPCTRDDAHCDELAYQVVATCD